ncbi:Phospholipase C [Mortierella sp. AM989]|nr:Phospholipase C [Mortierella sp. AM989]
MFDKIKRAINGWSQDSKPQSSLQPRPDSPSLGRKDPNHKRNRSIRNSLPARFRHSPYRDEYSSSSEVLPLPPPKDIDSNGTSETDKAQNCDTVNITQDATSPSSPKTSYIRRASSFQSQRASSESGRDNSPDVDIIMFTSVPPVSIVPSTSEKIPRAANRPGSIHKGSPDQTTALHSSLNSSNQESSVVQWPRGGSSSANRSQEHFLRSHRRTSTSSDVSLKDLQANLATTPPISSSFRQDLSGSLVTTEPQQTHSALNDGHSKTLTDTSAENATLESHKTLSSMTTIVAKSGSSSLDNTHQLVTQEHDVTKTPRNNKLSSLDPAIADKLALGTQMLKISAKKQHSRVFTLDLEHGRILWDSKKFGRINVEQIKELRKGKAASMYRLQLGVEPEHEERWLTIIYSAMGKYKALHLVAPTKDIFQGWIMAIEHLWSVKREVIEGLPQLQRKTHQWLQEHWKDADKNVDSKLGYEGVVQLCHRLNINFSRKEIRQRFEQADEKKQGQLDFEAFTRFVKLLKERKEVVSLFKKIAKSDSMTPSEFTDFMITTQKSKLDEDKIKEIYGKHIDKTDKTLEKFSVDSFTSFLVSVDNSIVSSKHMHVHQDMTQTLSNYYISSSHNTYLLGHQLTGISSIEGYIRALQSGCRCVELDCWDGPDGEPVIYHGRTLTSKILFRDVIEAISTYAFVNSPYPLILSLELHCDLDQQKSMAETMKTKLGSWLVQNPLKTDGFCLPSPNELKYKILVKSKVLPPDAISQEFTATDSDTESEKESESDSDSSKYRKPKTTTKKVRIAKELSDITVYCQSRHFPGFTHEGCSPFKIISFSERVSLRLAKQSLQEYINLNKNHLTRVYPAGFRINSTNYDPHHHWAAGAQVVALNYQSYDRGMQMNTAMFTMNGHCGYVLKPSPLRLGPDELCNHDKAQRPIKSPVKVTLHVISAQQLPRPNDAQSGDVVDPVCEVELHIPGQPAIKQKTHHVTDNGFNPTWDQKFEFHVDYEHHELVYFRFIIEDEDIKFSDMIASYCISLDCMEEGYRHIQLHDPAGEVFLYSTLFVKVSIEPVGVSELVKRSPAVRESTLPPLPRVASTQLAIADSITSRPSTEFSHGKAKSKSNLEVVCDRPLPLLPQIYSPLLEHHIALPPSPPPK